MSKERDAMAVNRLMKKMMPLCMANMMTEAETRIEEAREWARENQVPYKQKRNSDREITKKRRAEKQQKKKSRKGEKK